MNRIFLVRHGENYANITMEFSYRKVDYSLTRKGVQQAQQTAEFFRDKQINAIYASPLKRAVETAEIIGQTLELPVTIVESFREINVGALEGQKPTAALWAQHNAILHAWMQANHDVCFPDGENYPTLLGRMQAGLEEILPGKTGQNIVIVGHGGMFTLTLHDVCGGFEPTILSGGMVNCAVTELLAHWKNERVEAQLVSFARYDHLHGDAANFSPGSIDDESE
jgi:2,3-bisphosphoglycerate-dependent phosphoglycerate mutase